MLRQESLGFLQSSDHCHHSGHVLGSGSASRFLFAPEDQRKNRSFGRTLQKANAFGPAKLVRASADPIALTDAAGGHLADPLRGVAEKCNFPFAAELQDGLPWLNYSRFVIRCHDYNERRAAFGELFLNPVQIDDAIMRDWYAPEFRFKIVLGGDQHARMLDGGNPNFLQIGPGARIMMKHRV